MTKLDKHKKNQPPIRGVRVSQTPAASGLGERIRAARYKVGMSQTTLAQLVGVTKASVSEWELGHTQMKAEHLAAVAKALGVDPGTLLSTVDEETERMQEQITATKIVESAANIQDRTMNLPVTPSQYAIFQKMFDAPRPIRVAIIQLILAVHNCLEQQPKALDEFAEAMDAFNKSKHNA